MFRDSDVKTQQSSPLSIQSHGIEQRCVLSAMPWLATTATDVSVRALLRFVHLAKDLCVRRRTFRLDPLSVFPSLSIDTLSAIIVIDYAALPRWLCMMCGTLRTSHEIP
jgi:hypothetical protein